MIWIFKIQQYRCHLNNIRNATLFEGGLFSLLHCGEDTAVCVTKRESSKTEAVELVERDDTEELIHNIHHLLPSAPASLTHERDFSTIFCNFQTLLAAFFHRIYKLTNLETFWINLSYGSVGRCLQRCPASARSDSPGAVSPLSVSVLCSERQRSSAFSWPHRSRLLSKWVQNSVSKHLPLTDCLEL